MTVVRLDKRDGRRGGGGSCADRCAGKCIYPGREDLVREVASRQYPDPKPPIADVFYPGNGRMVRPMVAAMALYLAADESPPSSPVPP